MAGGASGSGGGAGRPATLSLTGAALAGLAAVAVGAAAVAAAQHRRRRRAAEVDKDRPDVPAPPAPSSGSSAGAAGEEGGDEAHSIKSRVGNFKVSKLSRLVEDIAVACGRDERFEVQGNSAEAAQAEEEFGACPAAADGTPQTAEDRQIELERRAVEGVLEILRLVRSSTVHRRLPHFHSVDRQLDAVARQLDVVNDNLADFWRYGREEPMADLLALPIVQLAIGRGEAAIVPIPADFVLNESESGDEPAEEQDPFDRAAALLGVSEEASRAEAEAAYRSRARAFHSCGDCIDRPAFHALTQAFERFVLGRDGVALPRTLPRSAGDDSGAKRGIELLSHYLLVGTDPAGSRYREFSKGLLDGPHRERLQQKVEVLVNWGEISGSTTGLGQG